MTDGAGMHDAVASANHQTTMRVPRKSNPRLKLRLRWVKRCVRRIHSELLPLGSVWVEERIPVMNLMEGLIVLPSQSQIQRQSRRELEIILDKKRIRPGARGDERILDLNAAVIHHSKQKVSEGISALGAGEAKVPDDAIRLIVVDRVMPKFTASLDT